MRVGLFYFPTDYGIDIRELARAAEERGFEPLFLPEHTPIPKHRRTGYPGGGRYRNALLIPPPRLSLFALPPLQQQKSYSAPVFASSRSVTPSSPQNASPVWTGYQMAVSFLASAEGGTWTKWRITE